MQIAPQRWAGPDTAAHVLTGFSLVIALIAQWLQNHKCAGSFALIKFGFRRNFSSPPNTKAPTIIRTDSRSRKWSVSTFGAVLRYFTWVIPLFPGECLFPLTYRGMVLNKWFNKARSILHVIVLYDWRKSSFLGHKRKSSPKTMSYIFMHHFSPQRHFWDFFSCKVVYMSSFIALLRWMICRKCSGGIPYFGISPNFINNTIMMKVNGGSQYIL